VVRQRLAFGVLAMVQVSLIAAISLVAVALPAVQEELVLDQVQLTLVAAGYGLSFGGLLILGGRLSDAWGPRRGFAAGLAVFGLASVTGGLAPGDGFLVAARFAQGVGAALAAPSALSLAGALFADPDHRTRTLAVWGGLSATGAVAGMLLSGVIVAWVGWRWVFAPPAAAALVAVAAAPVLLPRLTPMPPPRLDVPGALMATAGLSTLTYGLLALTRTGNPGAGWSITAVGGALVAAFAGIQARTPHPLLPLAHVVEPRRRLSLVTILLASAASAATNLFISLFLQQVRGIPPLQTSFHFLPLLLIAATGGPASRWIRRAGPEAVAAAGLAGASAGLLLLAFWLNGSFPALWPGLAVVTLGLGLSFSGSTVAALADVPAHERGVAGGVVNTAMEVGPTVGLAILVSVSRVKTTAMAQRGATWADATAAGYALALYVTALLFAVLCLAFVVGMRRPDVNQASVSRGPAHRDVQGEIP